MNFYFSFTELELPCWPNKSYFIIMETVLDCELGDCLISLNLSFLICEIRMKIPVLIPSRKGLRLKWESPLKGETTTEVSDMIIKARSRDDSFGVLTKFFQIKKNIDTCSISSSRPRLITINL